MSLFFTLITLIFVLSLPPVQRYITHKVSTALSEELGVKVNIGRVLITIRLELGFDKFFLGDLKKDTLISADRILVDIGGVNFNTNHIVLDHVLLKNAYINLKTSPSDPDFNYQFLIDKLSGNSKDTTASTPWQTSIKAISLENCKLNYEVEPMKGDYTHLIDYDKMMVSELNLEMSHIEIYSDSTLAKIENLSFLERSGFKVNKLDSDLKILSNIVHFNNTTIITPYSNIKTDYAMKFHDGDDFSYYIDSVEMIADIKQSTVSFYDLSYFAPELLGLTDAVEVKGKARGPVSDLRAKEFTITLFDKTFLKGSIELNGLPYIDNTFVFLNLEKFSTTVSDLNKIPIPPFTSKEFVSLPEVFNSLGNIDYKGNIVGFFNNVVAKGNIKTGLGIVNTDLKMLNLFNGKIGYKGSLSSENFDIGSFANQKKMLGNVSMKVNIDGEGVDENLTAKIDGNIFSIYANGYNYKNIAMDGNIDKKNFVGKVNINEDNVRLDFDGKIDFAGKIPVFNFEATLANANLSRLNIIDIDSLQDTRLTTHMIFNFTGSNIDNINGIIKFENTKYLKDKLIYYAKNIDVVTNESDGYRSIRLRSDFLDANIIGNLKFANLPSDFNGFINRYIPSYFDSSIVASDINKDSTTQDFNFSIYLKNTKPITRLFFPKIEIMDGSEIAGFYKSAQQEIKMDVQLPNILLQGNQFNKSNLALYTQNNRFFLNGTIKSFTSSTGLTINNISTLTDIGQNIANFDVKWDDLLDTNNYAGDLSGKAIFNKLTNINVLLKPSTIELADSIWTLSSDFPIAIDTSSVAVKDLNLSVSNKFVSLLVSGKISEDKSDSLTVIFDHFDISKLNFLTKPAGLYISGDLNGNGVLSNLYNSPFIKSDAQISDLVINEDKLGLAKISTKWVAMAKAINLNAAIYRGDIKTFELDGNYFPERNDENLDFNVLIDRLKLRMFDHYLVDIVSNISRKSIAMGELKIKGTLQKPDITGEISLMGVGFRVDYLNTYYTFANKINVAKDGFYFNNLVLNDTAGNLALINGKITHKNYRDFKLDVNVDMKNFSVLNTTFEQNELYFGLANVSGIMKATGPFDDVHLDISAKTEKGTKFYLPLNTASEVEDNSFITFVKKDTALKLNTKDEIELLGVSMNLDLTVTPDAEAQIIMDEKVGDVIKGKGNADFKFVITPVGDFYMYGDYVINEGDYLFTLQNTFNKHFTIEQGSSIKWNGDPYEGFVDIRAIYKPTVSLKPLRPIGNIGLSIDTTTRRLPVDCIIEMKNDLFNPTINFDIKFPELEASSQSYYETAVKPDLTQQVFSLLIQNSFIVPSNLRNFGGDAATSNATSNTLGANTSEFLTNQLNNWLSQISTDFNVGLKYQPGDLRNSSEVAVILSKQLFDDRVLVNGSFGKTGGTTEQASNIVGDVDVEVKIAKSGALKAKAYNKTNSTTDMLNRNALYTQGVGIFYRKEFDNVWDLFKGNKSKK